MAKEKQKGAPEAPRLLPKAAIALSTTIVSMDAEGKIHGPMTAFMRLVSDAEALLELDESGGEKFFALEVLRDFAADVLRQQKATWELLDKIDKGQITRAQVRAALEKRIAAAKEEVKPAPAAEGADHVGDTDKRGTDEGDTPLGRDVPKASL